MQKLNNLQLETGNNGIKKRYPCCFADHMILFGADSRQYFFRQNVKTLTSNVKVCLPNNLLVVLVIVVFSSHPKHFKQIRTFLSRILFNSILYLVFMMPQHHQVIICLLCCLLGLLSFYRLSFRFFIADFKCSSYTLSKFLL